MIQFYDFGDGVESAEKKCEYRSERKGVAGAVRNETIPEIKLFHVSFRMFCDTIPSLTV